MLCTGCSESSGSAGEERQEGPAGGLCGDGFSVGKDSCSLMTSLWHHTPAHTCPAVSCQIVMKTVNQLSAAAPHSHVMLLAHQRHSGKVLCACQVPKVTMTHLWVTSQGGRALFEASDWPWLSSSSSGLAVPHGLWLGGGGVPSPWGERRGLCTGCQRNRKQQWHHWGSEVGGGVCSPENTEMMSESEGWHHTDITTPPAGGCWELRVSGTCRTEELFPVWTGSMGAGHVGLESERMRHLLGGEGCGLTVVGGCCCQPIRKALISSCPVC